MKKILILMFVFVLLVSSVFGLSNQENNELFSTLLILDQNEIADSINIATNSSMGNGTVTGTLVTETGQVENAVKYNAFGVSNGSVLYDNDEILNTVINLTLGAWINPSDEQISGDQWLFLNGNWGLGIQQGKFRVLTFEGGADRIEASVDLGAGRVSILQNSPNILNVDHENLLILRITVNGTGATTTHINLIVNDSIVASGVGGAFSWLTGEDFQIGKSLHTDSFFYTNNTDELFLANASWSLDEVTHYFNITRQGKHFNGTAPLAPPPVDVTPPILTIFSPTPVNHSFTTSIIQTFNVSATDDVAVSTVIVNLNGTNSTMQPNAIADFFNITINTMAEGNFSYQFHVTDTSNNEFVSSIFFFNIDNTAPIITFTFPDPSNTTVADLNDITNINGMNINLDIANLTVFNSSNEIIFQNLTTGINNADFTFVDPINVIFANQPNADYRFRACFIDSANSESCQDVDMEFLVTVAPPITAAATFIPLEGALNLVGMVVLFGIILAAITGKKVFGRK